MKPPVVAAAALCLLALAAQPASAAWETSKNGVATAKAGTLADVTSVVCTANGAISWAAVTGASGYDVWWSTNNGANNFNGPFRVTAGTSYKVETTGMTRVRVQAVAGTNWSSAVVQKNC